MAQIEITSDYVDRPENSLIRDYNIAFAKGDKTFLVESATEDIVWDMVGDQTLEGLDPYKKFLDMLLQNPMIFLKIDHVFSEEKAGVPGIYSARALSLAHGDLLSSYDNKWGSRALFILADLNNNFESATAQHDLFFTDDVGIYSR